MAEYPMCVRHIWLTERTRSVDSRKDRWHPSPQLIRVLWPLGETIRMDGDESAVDTVKIFTQAVIVLM